MDDNGIIDLYFDRSEKAISETAVKYGKYCFIPVLPIAAISIGGTEIQINLWSK